MKAVRFHGYGGAGVLRCEDAPVPTPGNGELLVKVHAAGVNPADVQFRRGDYQAFAPLPLPFIPGWDLAGTVVATGAGVSGFEAGELDQAAEAHRRIEQGHARGKIILRV